jgi:OOP family OmpA-OmpF porin
MNYSTLKKTVALSFVSLMAVGMVKAQTSTTTTTKDSTMKMSSDVTTAKVFGGAGQYNTFSIGVNVGITSPQIPAGNDAVSHSKIALVMVYH